MASRLVRVVPVGMLQCNCIIVKCDATKECFVVDPGGDPERIVKECGDYTIKHILITHGHFDHILAAGAIKKKYPSAKIGIHNSDKFMYDNVELQMKAFGISSSQLEREGITFPLPEAETPIDHGGSLTLGDDKNKIRCEVVHTPGHSPGSCCFVFHQHTPTTPTHTGNNKPQHTQQTSKPLFVSSGDTLFQGSIGRTDLTGGSFDSIVASIRDRLYATLPDNTLVIPGHGPFTTIGAEKKSNPFVRQSSMTENKTPTSTCCSSNPSKTAKL